MFYHSLRVYFNFYLFCCIAVRTKSLLVNLLVELTPKSSGTRINTGFYLSKDFIVGKSKTSRIAGESVKSITILSMPKPIPPVGGIPSSSA